MNNVKGKTGEPAQRWAHLMPLALGALVVLIVVVLFSWGAHSLAEQIAQIKALVESSTQTICGA